VFVGTWRFQKVAIKKTLRAGEQQRKEFRHEADLLKGLRPHRNVIQVQISKIESI
jgi:hypothetical protein